MHAHCVAREPRTLPEVSLEARDMPAVLQRLQTEEEETGREGGARLLCRQPADASARRCGLRTLGSMHDWLAV